MKCEQAINRVGPYLDGELQPPERTVLEAHLATCDSCRAELEASRHLVSELAQSPPAPVPSALWDAIEHRLDAEPDIPSTAPGQRWRRGRRAVLAMAAVIALAVGLGIFGTAWSGSRAQAATLDFSVLLDALPLDAQKAFRKFLIRYGARGSSPAEARRLAPELNFDLPESLPGGFRLGPVFLLRVGDYPGVAAQYTRDGEFLAAIFHRPVQKEDYGTHKDHACVVGQHRGHKVEVGQWRLVHLTDPTTCHCVLSRLDEQTELPAVMAAVAPELPASHGDDHHH